MTLRGRSAHLSLAVKRGDVVMTIRRVPAAGGSMSGDSESREEWVADVVALMLSIADDLDMRSGPAPRVLRRPSLHSRHSTGGVRPLTPPVIALAGSSAPGVSSRPVERADPSADQKAQVAGVVQIAATHAAAVAQEAVSSAAERAATAATTARSARSAAVNAAADAVAARVAEAAAAVEGEADAAALTVAQAAFDAALLIASTVAPGSEREAALTATLVATAVSAIAIKTAAITAAAKADVAREAATAATAAALAAADAAAVVQLEVLCAADAVREVASATALTLSQQTGAEASAFARVQA